MLGKVVPDEIDLKTLGDIYTNVNRNNMAESLSNGHDDMTKAEAMEKIMEMEDEMVEEIYKEMPDNAEPLARAMAQQVIVNEINKRVEDGE